MSIQQGENIGYKVEAVTLITCYIVITYNCEKVKAGIHRLFKLKSTSTLSVNSRLLPFAFI
ncbi:hypothetical protein NIES4071_24530 [Calothrix sp. NIES-4071]|nr:hypothetical protein NIES4071_24530 [Calothrix sp. NIES-4071]BAZ56776.1 hypothetical protein NIES4105_24470 [Calothrix sp. NIES-4105]